MGDLPSQHEADQPGLGPQRARGRRGAHVLHVMFGRALNLRRSANLERQVLHGPIARSTNALDDAPQYYERVCLRAAAEHCGIERPQPLRPPARPDPADGYKGPLLSRAVRIN